MGWLGNYVGSDLSLKEIKNYIKNIVNDDKNNTVKYISLKFGVAYLAVEHKEDKIYGLVALWKYSKKTGEIDLKFMDETVHPYYYGATAKLLKMLHPTDNINSLEWRYACWRNFKKIPEDIEADFKKNNIGQQ